MRKPTSVRVAMSYPTCWEEIYPAWLEAREFGAPISAHVSVPPSYEDGFIRFLQVTWGR
ncbi:hypothetical protein LCGC14_1168700 [marine sediment metagenome]|uniref:Amidohydrolase-related domain-containing protein n=1 Tax=marine sediment metagenome TaxID=412755 RepID=A0A0F9P8N2_9ZZZZ